MVERSIVPEVFFRTADAGMAAADGEAHAIVPLHGGAGIVGGGPAATHLVKAPALARSVIVPGFHILAGIEKRPPVLIVLPESFTNPMHWETASYWDRRLWYRTYPVKCDLVILTEQGQYHNFFEKLVSNRPGMSDKPVALPVFDPSFLNKYDYIVYPQFQLDMIPNGFEKWQEKDSIVIARREGKR